MRNLIILFLLATAAGTAAPKRLDGLVWIEGGIFRNTRSNYHAKSMTNNPYIGKTIAVSGFYIGRCEVTQQEWREVMGSNPSKFKGDTLPVETVCWYDCIEYCNRRSEKEGLTPCYTIDKVNRDPANQTAIDDMKWTVTINAGADGYRLPTEIEWEYAASGGQQSRNYTYSGSDEIGQIAWFWQNAGDKKLTGQWHWPTIERNHTRTQPVGGKAPNELGLYDMSGNVREWCWDWYGELEPTETGAARNSHDSGRVWRGGGWLGADFCCASSFRAGYEANGRGPDQGFRVCRNK
jgi:formylglycine-generating enzyme required for sulfatase activity